MFENLHRLKNTVVVIFNTSVTVRQMTEMF